MLQIAQNQRLLLDLVRRHGPVSRAELSDLSGLTPGAVTRLTKELLLSSLLSQGDPRQGQRGQPALPLSLHGPGAFGIGAAFGPGQVDVVLVNLAGEVVGHRQRPLPESDPQTAATLVAELAEELRAAAALTASRCLGLGLAVPGFKLDEPGQWRTVGALRSWSRRDLETVFAATTGRRVWIENVASAGAFGEFYSARRKGARHLIFLHLGFGLGAGLILDGDLFRGARGNAGEIGGLFPVDQARPSGSDLLATLQAAGLPAGNLAELATVPELAAHPTVQAWVLRVSQQLQDVALGACRWLDPAEIVLGGPIPGPILQAVSRQLQTHFATLGAEQPAKPQFSVSELGAQAPAVGAAMIPVHKFCAPRAKDDTVYRPQTARPQTTA